MKALAILPIAVFALLWPDFSAADSRVDVIRDASASRTDRWAHSLLDSSGVVIETVRFIEVEFNLPRPLTIQIGGEDGPLYDPDSTTIVIPLEFLAEIREKLVEHGYAHEADEIDAAVVDVFEHTLYHELGHFLVDVLNLPITGREEDAVDELGYILLIDLYQDGGDVALTAADVFFIEGDTEDGPQESDFWAEHSLDIQRFYNGVCLIYGSDPKRYADVAAESGMDRDRLELCEDEYARKRDAWFQMLDPYLR